MNRPFQSYGFLLSLLISLPFSIANCLSYEQAPNSLAIKEKLRVPIYYAATSGIPPQSMEAFIKKPTAFKMEARYIVDKFSARQNNQLWLNAILTSNSRNELRSFENAILQFSQLIKVDMYKGDRLVFNVNPYQGTYLSINNVDLGVITDLKFQTALVSIWFGERQPSKKFATDIRQAPASKLLREFEALAITNERSAALKSLKVASASPASINTTPKTNNELSKQTQQITLKNSIATKSEQSKEAQEGKDTPASKKVVVQTKATAQELNKPSANKQEIVKQEATLTKPSTDQLKNEKSLPLANQSERQKSATSTTTKVSVVDQMFNLLQQDYQAELKQYIEQNARPAPPIGVRKKPEGAAVIKVQLKSDNNKVVVKDSQVIHGNFDDNLLEAMQQSIKRLKSMPPIPEAIDDQLISIEVTLDFSRCKRATSVWICF